MPNSINGNTPTPQNNTSTTTQATFKVGDTVLCPHWGKDSYTIQESGFKDFPLQICGQFAPDYENSYFCFDENGINTVHHAIFHDTPANRQAIATLYHSDNTPAEKPTYKPDVWEIKHGKISNGIFHRPFFVVCRNGEYIDLDNSISSYRYVTAFHIMLHLQAISNDNFTIEPISWQPMTGYNVILDSVEVQA